MSKSSVSFQFMSKWLFSAFAVAVIAGSSATRADEGEVETFVVDASGLGTLGGGAGDDEGARCRVRIEKIGPKEIKVGSFFDYFIRVENLDRCEIEDLELKDIAPERVKYESAYPNPRKVEGGEFLDKIEWRRFDLDPKEVKVFHLRVHVVGPPNRTLVNRACIETDGFDYDEKRCVTKKTEVVTGGEEE